MGLYRAICKQRKRSKSKAHPNGLAATELGRSRSGPLSDRKDMTISAVVATLASMMAAKSASSETIVDGAVELARQRTKGGRNCAR